MEDYLKLIYEELKSIRYLLENNSQIVNSESAKIQSDAGDIEKYLIENNIEYIKEFEIQPGKTTLYCDFYLPDYNMVIEYDGEQHFFIVDKFVKNGNPLDTLNTQQYLDRLKDRYCKENNINLLRIPYTMSVSDIHQQLSQINDDFGIKIIMPHSHKINTYDSKHKKSTMKDNYYLYNSKIDEFAEIYHQFIGRYDISPLLIQACYKDFIQSFYPTFKESLYYKEELQRKYKFDFSISNSADCDMLFFENGYHMKKLRGLI